MTGEVVSYSGPGPGESKTAEHPAGNEIEEGRRSCSPPSSPRRCPFQIHVDVDQLGRIAGTSVLDSPGKSSLGRRSIGSGSFMGVRKRTHLHNKTAEEVERIVQAGKVRELKNCIRNHHWLPFDCVRSRLWQVFERNFVDYNYFSLNSYLRCRSSAVFTSRIKLQWIRCTGTRSNRFTGLMVWKFIFSSLSYWSSLVLIDLLALIQIWWQRLVHYRLLLSLRSRCRIIWTKRAFKWLGVSSTSYHTRAPISRTLPVYTPSLVSCSITWAVSRLFS